MERRELETTIRHVLESLDTYALDNLAERDAVTEAITRAVWARLWPIQVREWIEAQAEGAFVEE